MAERFAEIDNNRIIDKMKDARDVKSKVPGKIKHLISKVESMSKLLYLLASYWKIQGDFRILDIFYAYLLFGLGMSNERYLVNFFQQLHPCIFPIKNALSFPLTDVSKCGSEFSISYFRLCLCLPYQMIPVGLI